MSPVKQEPMPSLSDARKYTTDKPSHTRAVPVVIKGASRPVPRYAPPLASSVSSTPGRSSPALTQSPPVNHGIYEENQVYELEIETINSLYMAEKARADGLDAQVEELLIRLDAAAHAVKHGGGGAKFSGDLDYEAEQALEKDYEASLASYQNKCRELMKENKELKEKLSTGGGIPEVPKKKKSSIEDIDDGGMSPEEKARRVKKIYEELYVRFDTNGDKSIQFEEFEILAKMLEGRKYTSSHAAKAYRTMDLDADGGVNREEFEAYVFRKTKGLDAKHFDALFVSMGKVKTPVIPKVPQEEEGQEPETQDKAAVPSTSSPTKLQVRRAV